MSCRLIALICPFRVTKILAMGPGLHHVSIIHLIFDVDFAAVYGEAKAHKAGILRVDRSAVLGPIPIRRFLVNRSSSEILPNMFSGPVCKGLWHTLSSVMKAGDHGSANCSSMALRRSSSVVINSCKGFKRQLVLGQQRSRQHDGDQCKNDEVSFHCLGLLSE